MARLAQVLDALRALAADGAGAAPNPTAQAAPAGPSAAPSGEAAALAAFRQARDAAARPEATAAGAGIPRIPQPRTGDGYTPGEPVAVEIGSVRLAGGPGTAVPAGGDATRADRLRWRPLRFGLVATLAGCMLGGAAVVAGLVPSPLSDTGRPGPAVSVSGEDTPEGPAPAVRGSGSAPSAPDGAPGTGTGRPPSGGTGGGPDGDTSGTSHGKDTKRHGETAENWWAKMINACQDYRGGKELDDTSEQQLEDAAKGSERVARFCDSLLDDQGAGGDRPDGSQDGAGDNHETSGNAGAGGDGKDGQEHGPGSGGGPESGGENTGNHGGAASPSASGTAPAPSETSSPTVGVTFSEPVTQ
ncbi:hypothetical protein [Streptomyces sulfonofaciens]|nr:hypothetical protein [Streptomyces sulfonofaciens]